MEAMDITVARGLLMPMLYPQLMLMLSLDSIEDTMVDILVDTMAMVAMEAMCITWARGLLMLTLSLDSTEDMVDMVDIEDMEAMDITVARDLLMLRLSLDSMEDTVEDTMVDTVALDMEIPRPLWVQLAALLPATSNATVIVFGTSPTSTETAQERMPLAANVLETLGRPCLSFLSFGSWSSERLSALEELCAWSGGLSLNLQDPEALPLAIKSLTQTFMSPERSNFLTERRHFYHQKENVGCTRWHLSHADIIHDMNGIDSSSPSMNMLEVLQDVEFTPKRRWARSLRWWRRHRGLRDCVFADRGTLGVDLDMDKDGYWRVCSTHPPASALNLQSGSILEAINRFLVKPRTPRIELSKRLSQRPVSLTFRSQEAELVTKVEDVLAEVVVSEFRERFPILRPSDPPLSWATEKKDRPGKVDRLRGREAARSSSASSSAKQVSARIDTASLFTILCYAGSLELLQRCAMTCKTWHEALRLPRGREPLTPAQGLWSFLIRYGDSVKRRPEFWNFLRSEGAELGTSFDAHILLLGAGQLLGLTAAEKALNRLEEVLGFNPRPFFQHGRATVIWGLGSQALVDLCTLTRSFQVMLAAAYMPFFRSLSSDGMGPELFFVKWLLTLFTDVLQPEVLMRLR